MWRRAVLCSRNVMATSTIPDTETPAPRGRRAGVRTGPVRLALPLLHAAPDRLEVPARPGHLRHQCVADLLHAWLSAALVQLSADVAHLGRLRAGRRDAAIRLHVRDVVQRDQLIDRGLRVSIRRGSLAASKEFAQETHRSPPDS